MKSLFPAETLGSPSAATDAVAIGRDEFNRIADRLEKLAAALGLAREGAPDRITDDMRMSSTQMMGGSLLGARRQSADEDVSKLPAEHVFI